MAGPVHRVVWFRRDLRTRDHPALAAAVAGAGGDPVLPLFVLVPEPWQRLGGPARAYVAASLRALRDDLGGLHVRTGDAAAALVGLAAAVGPLEVHVTEAHTPRGRARDARVAEALAASGSRLVVSGANYAVPPGEVRKPDGTPYRVFTPFHRAWLDHGWERPVPRPAAIPVWAPEGDPLPPVERLPGTTVPEAGEAAALERWAAFAAGPLADYGELRDRPDLAATSRLSIPLRWGELHPRTLLAALDPQRDRRFVAELGWREFYADVLFHEPHSLECNLDPAFDRMVHDEGPAADALLAAWAEGRTGYPFVDAGMRQLRAEGWMHNRVRMVVASFLVKDLHLPWWRGEREFMRWLIDGDPASNAHGWQWVAGSGTDAAPYFRVFNPVLQGLKFDPDGAYVRRYVPELNHLAGAAAHEPWKVLDGYAHGYPEPVVDHAEERAEALRRYAAIKEG
ncbi:MAG: DNA photolyase family protein [Candidatus Nanopelagicales bacterium]|jgi:deoxyribodipyrimidine photo-lyase|nr:DNA photolyase family protein [Candidatus Nanopelagicales bacterium]